MINFTIFFDVICPWCYIGKQYLDLALDKRFGAYDIQSPQYHIEYHIFQLNPNMPIKGMDRQEYLRNKFGHQADNVYENIYHAGLKAGIDFQFDKIKKTPNTLIVHSLIYLIQKHYPQHTNDIINDLYQGYFLQSGDLTDTNYLLDIVYQYCGTDNDFKEMLDQHDIKDFLKKQDNQSRIRGITGVPFMIINNQYVVNGAQDTNALLPIIDLALQDTSS